MMMASTYLLLEIFADSLEINVCIDSKRTQDVRVTDSRKLK